MPSRDPHQHTLLAVPPTGEPASAEPVMGARRAEVSPTIERRGVNLDPLVLWGLGFLAAAGVVFLVGWIGVARNNEEWRQLPIVISAGGAGAVLLAIGSSLFGANEHRLDRAAIGHLVERIEDLDRSMAEMREANAALEERIEDLLGESGDTGRRPGRGARGSSAGVAAGRERASATNGRSHRGTD